MWIRPKIGGSHDDSHIFAGGHALYMTALSKPLPLLNWVLLSSLQTQISDPGYIWDILVLKSARIIVLACDGGVFWSIIPAPPPKTKGCLASLLEWLNPPPPLDAFQ